MMHHDRLNAADPMPLVTASTPPPQSLIENTGVLS